MNRIAVVALMLFPSTCCALMISEVGNKPLSAQNYQDWPNLVDAVNDESRVLMVWVNGHEDLSFHGNTEAANRVLKEFAETEAPELNLVILPGPGRTQKIENKPVRIDYRIEIHGGLVGAVFKNRPTVRNLQPTMTIYITENIELAKLKVPDNVKLLHLRDLESRYLAASNSEDKSLQDEAIRYLEALHAEFRRKDAEFDQLQTEIEAIKAFVEKCQQRRNSK